MSLGTCACIGVFCVLRAKTPGGAGIMLNWLSAKLMTTPVGDFLLAKTSFEKGLTGHTSGTDATTVQKA